MSTPIAGTHTPIHALSTQALLDHWQGHRRLTRRVIDAFPEADLLAYSLGGMRPFGAMAMELISIAEPMVRGIVTGDWPALAHEQPASKADILKAWDQGTDAINRLWPEIPAGCFQETMTAFGQYPGQVHDLVLYAVDNEIHHRGQAYVYLRSLGIEPPPFYERE